jgi:putative ABC transport system permease protein
MRAGLTVLGVVIGIAAVTTMVSIGQSARKLVLDQFEAIGTNIIVVFPEANRRDGVRQGRTVSLTADDADAIAEECDAIVAASPIVGVGGQLIYANLNWQPNEIAGVGPAYLTVRNWQIRYGGFFSESDIQSAAKVCVIGQTIVAKLFQTMNPIGETVRIGSIPLKIVGILEPKGANLVGEDQDNLVLIPYTTVRKRIYGSNFDDVHVILASARTSALASQAQQQIKHLLLERHDIEVESEADFRVQDTAEFAKILNTVTGIMTALLASIAGISLLVGGVGIMNIMLVSVTERTREIGIRMAVGARSSDILRQFLIEAIILSCIGGVIGFVLGVSASVGVTMGINSWTQGSKWPIVISLPAAAMAFVFAALVGVFFGFYPARRASRLDPIEALRYE